MEKFRIVPIVLDSAADDASEVVYTLVDRATWIPPVLPMRWVMSVGRWKNAPQTVLKKLISIAWLYQWGDERFEKQGGLDEVFRSGYLLTGDEIKTLITYLRMGGKDISRVRMVTLVSDAIAIKEFLVWASDPHLRGGVGTIHQADLIRFRERLNTLFEPIARNVNKSERINPLTTKADAHLAKAIGPDTLEDGRAIVPLQFTHPDNPWEPTVRLRNWLIYQIMRECGLRIGEVMSLLTTSILTDGDGDQYLVVRRLHSSRAHTRTRRRYTKRGEREIPISGLLRSGLRQYQTTPFAKGGRRGARSPFLFVDSVRGDELAVSTGTKIFSNMSEVLRAAGFRGMSSHSLRHTCFEEHAWELLNEHGGDEGRVIELLRQMGGWSANSRMPAHYCQLAIRRFGFDYLRKRNQERWRSADSSLPVAAPDEADDRVFAGTLDEARDAGGSAHGA